MRRPRMFLVDDLGQPLPTHVEQAVMHWLPRLRATFPSLEDATLVDVLEAAALRVVRRESRGGRLEHVHAYAWTAIRSVAISHVRLGAERLRSVTTEMTSDDPVTGRVRGPSSVEARVLVRQLLRQLTPLERRVFWLKLAGYSTREIVSFPDRLTGESRLLPVRSGHAEIEV